MNTYFSGIPPVFKNATIYEFNPAIMTRTARFGAEDEKPWMFISGRTGVGKTHLAAAMCNDLYYKFSGRFFHYFINPQQMVDRINSTYSNGSSENKQDVMREYYGFSKYITVGQYMGTPELPFPMVIDDLGIEKNASPDIESIISVRGDHKAITIFTSNLSLDDLAKKYSDRIASRIRGLAIPIIMEGEDRRGLTIPFVMKGEDRMGTR